MTYRRLTGQHNRTGNAVQKILAITDYNKAKQSIDRSNQMISYFIPLRKANTFVVNMWLIYNHFLSKKIQIITFWEELVLQILGMERNGNSQPVQIQQRQANEKHTLTTVTEKDKSNRKIWQKCTGCYAEVAKKGRDVAQKIVKLMSTKCKLHKKLMFTVL